MASPRIVVIGSINMDLVCRTQSMPLPGQTLIGSDFRTIPGGKGANQAVAAAKLGAHVHMIGRVGDDDFGQRLLHSLTQHNVDTRHVTITEGIATGTAMIIVDRKGENAIIVVPGANHALSNADIDAAEETIAAADVVIMQLEIPLPTVQHAIALCQRRKIRAILDPAPAPPKLPRALYGVDILTPNQGEAEVLLGLQRTHLVRRKRVVDPKQLGAELLAKGARQIVLKLGAKGAMIIGRDGKIERIKPVKVDVIDTTAAGDAFNAALAVELAGGGSLSGAVRFANAAGAACCRAFGAQPSLPTADQVRTLMPR
jgi:ribokinase